MQNIASNSRMDLHIKLVSSKQKDLKLVKK